MALAGCGREVAHGGEAKSAADAKRTAVSDATDLIPADLDLVVRVDLTKVRDHLGEAASKEVVDKALEETGSRGLLRQVLADAEVVWLGLRLADLELGDRVMVVRTRGASSKPDATSWKSEATSEQNLLRFDARVPPPRNGIERIFLMGQRDVVFVSPVESMSVARVIDKGPDAKRGQPKARGLLSVDYRATRISAGLAEAYPSLSSLISGVVRLDATLELIGGQLQLDGRLRCKTAGAATKVLRFLETIRDAGKEASAYAELLGALELERQGDAISIRWPLPREVVAAWIHGSTQPPAPNRPPKAADSPTEPDHSEEQP